jgi:hypothetical protein
MTVNGPKLIILGRPGKAPDALKNAPAALEHRLKACGIT